MSERTERLAKRISGTRSSHCAMNSVRIARRRFKSSRNGNYRSKSIARIDALVPAPGDYRHGALDVPLLLTRDSSGQPIGTAEISRRASDLRRGGLRTHPSSTASNIGGKPAMSSICHCARRASSSSTSTTIRRTPQSSSRRSRTSWPARASIAEADSNSSKMRRNTTGATPHFNALAGLSPSESSRIRQFRGGRFV